MGLGKSMAGSLFSATNFIFLNIFLLGIGFGVGEWGLGGGWAHIFHAEDGGLSDYGKHNMDACTLYQLDRGLPERFWATPKISTGEAVRGIIDAVVANAHSLGIFSRETGRSRSGLAHWPCCPQ